MLDNRPLDLAIVHKARYDSEDVKGSPKCESGTRVHILGSIKQWANNDPNQPLFWLVGPAGTGKSTIARSVIDIFEMDKRSVAGYFFKRGEQDRNDTNRIFSTIAIQIADSVLSFRESLRKSLEGLDKDAVEKFNLEKQFQKLLWQPLETLRLDEKGHQRIMIIIDALDECERPEHLQRVLGLLSRLCKISIIRFRVLITSRSAPDIVEAFEPHTKNNAVRMLQLHRELSEETKMDIRKFLEAKFRDIRSKRSVQKQSWPTAEELDHLVHLSTTPEPLFIYAATLCRFVSDKQRGPIRQLTIWLEQGGNSQLQQIYRPILDQAFSDFDQEEFRQKLQFLASIVLVAKPLSAKCIASILGVDLDDISWWTPRLFAVLHLPPGFEQPIELLHKSFSDFLTTDSGSNKYRIDTAETHSDLTEKCIQQMKAGLTSDVCNIQKLSTARKSIDQNRVSRFIPNGLQYACVYWFYHLECSGRPLDSFTYNFLYDHLLHWIEVLALLGQLAEGAAVLGRLVEISQSLDAIDQEFLDFVKDANRVMSFFGPVIDRYPLQIYGSLLFFSPVASKVRQRFWHQRIPTSGKIQGIEPNWDARVQSIESSHGNVEHVTFSPNGHLLAFALEDEESHKQRIELRNIITGTSMHSFEISGELVKAIAFSTDGHLLASAHRGGNIRILTLKTGQVELISPDQSHEVQAIAFLPDSHLVASLSRDGKMRCWEKRGSTYQEKSGCFDALDGALIPELKTSYAAFSPYMKLLAFQPCWIETEVYDVGTGAKVLMLHHDLSPDCFAFSADSRLLAVSCSRVLTIWDLKTGSEKLMIYPPEALDSLAFSPNSQVLASGTYGTIRLWDLENGVCKAILQEGFGMMLPIKTLAFSPNSQLLADPRQLWDVTLPQETDRPDRHSDEINTVAWSPGGQIVASASWDKTIQIWDAVTGIRQRVLVGHTASVDELLFSSDGHLLASASRDKTVRIWSMSSGALQKTIVDDWGCISHVAYSEDGQIAASRSSSSGQRFKLWKVATRTHLRTPDIPREFIQRTGRWNTIVSMTFSPNGSIIAASTDKNSLVCWDTATGKLLRETPASGPINRVIFSPDSQLIALQKVREVSLWRVTEASSLQSLYTGKICRL
ncbi:hypothetical protein FSARC_14046, partial [Fusarium sarcochroum]